MDASEVRGRWLLLAGGFSLLAMALAPATSAFAAAPKVTITSPRNGSTTTAEKPTFNGLAEEGAGPVTLAIYAGKTASGKAVEEMSAAAGAGGAWSLVARASLKNATYTARARQTNTASQTGMSAPVTFTVNTPPPSVTLNSPENPTSNITPSFAGTASGIKPVNVEIHAGATTKGSVVATATGAVGGGNWSSSAASPALPIGQYTAVATEEGALAGDPTGRSAPATFTVALAPPGGPAAPLHPPPLASFTWFPSAPQTGESVSLVSTSSDLTSAIIGLAWDLSGSGPFHAAGAVLTTSFAAAGPHVVRLLVINADGLASVATQTITVVGPRVYVMQPYPIVRIVGSETRFGVKLRLLQVQQLRSGARITVRCAGRQCPIRSTSRVAALSRRPVPAVEFRAFERFLHYGVRLEILITAPGEIGKYTRFLIRRGKLPLRTDSCLDPTGAKPLACPSS
jgi:Bacterial Ig-like domain